MVAILARLLNPIIWRVPGHAARKLFGFSLAEHGSMLDLANAAHLAPSAERRALYLRHMLDEARHVRMFASRSSELRLSEGLPSLGYPVADTEDLFASLGEVRFLAFVHLGERRACEQFGAYSDWFERQGDRKSEAMFNAILRDESRHQSYTYDLLVELAGSAERARAEIRAARLWEKWRTWRRMGRFLAEKTYFALMLLIYGVSAPLTRLATAWRPRPAGWTNHVTAPPVRSEAAAPAVLEWTGA